MTITLPTTVRASMVTVASALMRRFPHAPGVWRLRRPLLDLIRKVGPSMGVVTIATRDGFRMELQLGDWVDQHLYVTGAYEEPVREIVLRVLTPGDLFVDVGANIGYFSLLAATVVEQSGSVISIEPSKSIHERLKRNVSFNPDLAIQLHALAVGASSGEVEFHTGPETHSGTSSLRKIPGTSASSAVEMTTLSELLASRPVPKLLKIDVEGAELQVFRGMTTLWEQWQEKRPDILFELSQSYLQEMGDSAEELCKLLYSKGYSLYRCEFDGLRTLNTDLSIEPEQCNIFATCNPDMTPIADLFRNE